MMDTQPSPLLRRKNILCCLLVLATSCSQFRNVTPPNRSPSLQSEITSTTIEQDMTGELSSNLVDPEGDEYTCSWTQTSGATATLNDPNACDLVFTAPRVADTLVFQLTATDSLGKSTTIDYTVTVTKDSTLIGPWENTVAANVRSLSDVTVNNNALTSTLEDPIVGNKVTIADFLSPADKAVFIRCNELVWDAPADYIRVSGTRGSSGTTVAGAGGAGGSGGGGGGNQLSAGSNGSTGGADGLSTGGAAGGLGYALDYLLESIGVTTTFNFGTGGNGGAGESSGAGTLAGGTGGAGSNGAGGGGGGGAGSHAVVAPTVGGSGGGGGGGLIVIVAKSISIASGAGVDLRAAGGSGDSANFDGGGGGGGVIWVALESYNGNEIIDMNVSGGGSANGGSGTAGTAQLFDFNLNAKDYTSDTW